jgi:hypothetical protein
MCLIVSLSYVCAPHPLLLEGMPRALSHVHLSCTPSSDEYKNEFEDLEMETKKLLEEINSDKTASKRRKMESDTPSAFNRLIKHAVGTTDKDHEPLTHSPLKSKSKRKKKSKEVKHSKLATGHSLGGAR